VRFLPCAARPFLNHTNNLVKPPNHPEIPQPTENKPNKTNSKLAGYFPKIAILNIGDKISRKQGNQKKQLPAKVLKTLECY
jgi:hypothetical protein